MFTENEERQLEQIKDALADLHVQAANDFSAVEDAIDEYNRTAEAHNDLVEVFEELMEDICSRLRDDDEDGLAELVGDAAAYVYSAEQIELPTLDDIGDDLRDALAKIEALAAANAELETA